MPSFVFLLFFLPFISAEKYYNLTNDPDPPKPWKCGADKPGRICDPDRPQMLTKEQRNELMDLVEEFTELTKMSGSIGIEDCARKGIKLGISLAHFSQTESDQNKTNNLTLTELFVEKRYRKREENSNNSKLTVNETNGNGCNRTMFIVMTADPPDVHIWSHPSVPISTSEKEAIIANHANLIVTGEYADALKAIIANLRWLILKHQSLVPFGQNEGHSPPKMPFYGWIALSIIGSLVIIIVVLLAICTLQKRCKSKQVEPQINENTNNANVHVIRMTDIDLEQKEEKQNNVEPI